MHYPTDRIIHTTAFGTPVVGHWLERVIAQWIHHEGSIRRPIHRTMSERSYHGATSRSDKGLGRLYFKSDYLPHEPIRSLERKKNCNPFVVCLSGWHCRFEDLKPPL